MCTSNISSKKFLKLFLEIEFYKIIFWLVFNLTGYEMFSLKKLLKALLPIYDIGTGFTASYLLFFLFIPFCNILIHAMSEKQHLTLIVLCLGVESLLTTFLMAHPAFSYVGWFVILYFMSAYVRLYPEANELQSILKRVHIEIKDIFSNIRFWAIMLACSLLVSWASVVVGALIYNKEGLPVYYYFVSDSYKVLAVVTGVSSFMFFKNLKMGYHSWINRIAASTFGVLLIHANSDSMRQWLWGDTLAQVDAFRDNMFVLHSVFIVIGVFVIATLIDMIRINMFENPLLNWLELKTQRNRGGK